MEEKRKFDLEERTLCFLKNVIAFLRTVRKDFVNIELGKQLIRSAGSVGANYREANEAVSKKDFAYRIRICRKEAKESSFWLSAYECNNELEEKRKMLLQEATELAKIFGSMVKRLEENGF
ncbi:MAG: four helix bundle protein [Bacteroidota bacterium]